MTDDKIISLAQEAGRLARTETQDIAVYLGRRDVHLARLIEQHVRAEVAEACAQIADDMDYSPGRQLAATIRALGKATGAKSGAMTVDEIIGVVAEVGLGIALRCDGELRIYSQNVDWHDAFVALVRLVEQRANAWRPAIDPPDDQRNVLAWCQGRAHVALHMPGTDPHWYQCGSPDNEDWYDLNAVTHWRDIEPPEESK